MRESILEIHKKTLDFLLKKWEKENLYFLPRIKNNKHRLDLGYYFIGNDDYLQISFWEGRDWKAKTHNIGFVIKKDKSSYIELCSRASDEKTDFLKRIVSELEGFKRLGKNKKINKWQKHYKDTDYLKNLKEFIKYEKPKIDKLIKKHRPDNINLLNSSFNKYIVRVAKLRDERKKSKIIQAEENNNEGNLQNTDKIESSINKTFIIEPVHNKMQNAIYKSLKNSDRYKRVLIEKDRVDLKAETYSGDWHYYEVKTNNPKLSIRNALGQIIEYAYFPNNKRAEKLIIVSEEKPKKDIKNYLSYIRKQFNIPVYYCSFDWRKEELSVEY